MVVNPGQFNVGIYPRGFSQNTDWPWPLVRADDKVLLNYGKALREGERSIGPIPVYGTNGRCGCHSVPLVKGPGVILGRKGQGPLGVEWCDSDFWVIDTAYYVTTKTDDLDLKYFYYLVKYVGLNHLKDGTSNPSLSRNTFGALLLPIPKLVEQQAIASILGALDDKMELNWRMNQTLEAMARAIFKSWFVDFDPVRAKAAGRQPPGLPPRLADLFPDSFEIGKLEGAPKGRTVSTVGTYFRLTMGQSPPGSTYNENYHGLLFYQGRTDFGFRFPCRRVFCSLPTRFAQPGDTLVSVRAPVGDVNIALERCAIGRGVAAIRHRSGSRSFTFYSMQNLSEHFLKFEAEGTVFGSINKSDFERLPFMEPTGCVLEVFDRIVSPVDDRIEVNERASSVLSALREALLPKLISGELRISDAERIVERCV